MRKYWYYTYKTVNGLGSGICHSDDGEFDIIGRMNYLKSEHPEYEDSIIIIDNWKEISSTQYEKLKEYFDNQNK